MPGISGGRFGVPSNMSAILEYLFELFVLMVLGKVLNSAIHRFFGGNTVRFGFPGQRGRPGSGKTAQEPPKT
ncbi:MAG: hypothetical protein ACRD2O_08210, partial [Terriglobia bacterium]